MALLPLISHLIVESVESPNALITAAGIVVLTEFVDVFAGVKCDVLSVFLPVVGWGLDIIEGAPVYLKTRIMP